jgi:hypothetical protein
MLLGFPFDYWEDEYADTVVGPFGKVISWDKDLDHRTRMIVRARVVDLDSVPHFIVFSKPEGFDSESWTIQCEILQQEMLGGGPPDEDPIPVGIEQVGHLPFAFYGLGQQGQSGQQGQGLPNIV